MEITITVKEVGYFRDIMEKGDDALVDITIKSLKIRNRELCFEQLSKQIYEQYLGMLRIEQKSEYNSEGQLVEFITKTEFYNRIKKIYKNGEFDETDMKRSGNKIYIKPNSIYEKTQTQKNPRRFQNYLLVTSFADRIRYAEFDTSFFD